MNIQVLSNILLIHRVEIIGLCGLVFLVVIRYFRHWVKIFHYLFAKLVSHGKYQIRESWKIILLINNVRWVWSGNYFSSLGRYQADFSFKTFRSGPSWYLSFMKSVDSDYLSINQLLCIVIGKSAFQLEASTHSLWLIKLSCQLCNR